MPSIKMTKDRRTAVILHLSKISASPSNIFKSASRDVVLPQHAQLLTRLDYSNFVDYIYRFEKTRATGTLPPLSKVARQLYSLLINMAEMGYWLGSNRDNYQTSYLDGLSDKYFLPYRGSRMGIANAADFHNTRFNEAASQLIALGLIEMQDSWSKPGEVILIPRRFEYASLLAVLFHLLDEFPGFSRMLSNLPTITGGGEASQFLHGGRAAGINMVLLSTTGIDVGSEPRFNECVDIDTVLDILEMRGDTYSTKEIAATSMRKTENVRKVK